MPCVIPTPQSSAFIKSFNHLSNRSGVDFPPIEICLVRVAALPLEAVLTISSVL